MKIQRVVARLQETAGLVKIGEYNVDSRLAAYLKTEQHVIDDMEGEFKPNTGCGKEMKKAIDGCNDALAGKHHSPAAQKLANMLQGENMYSDVTGDTKLIMKNTAKLIAIMMYG